MRSLLILVACARVASADKSCVTGDLFTKDALHADLAFLASKELDGRAPGSDGDVQARKLVEARFTCLGLQPAGDGTGFTQAFDSDKKHTANLIGYVKGSDPKLADDIVMISAHLDHLGDGHLGANDDASGVVALLAIAQAVVQDPPKRTLAFVVFGAEEDGMVGSGFYAKHPAKALPLAHVVQFVELDMVGSYNSSDLVAAMGAFKGFGARTLLDKHLTKKLHVSAGGKARGSDFQPFCALGVPYTFFWTPDHKCYHERCDTLDRIDMPHLIEIAVLAGALVHDLGATDLDLAGLRAKKGCGV